MEFKENNNLRHVLDIWRGAKTIFDLPSLSGSYVTKKSLTLDVKSSTTCLEPC